MKPNFTLVTCILILTVIEGCNAQDQKEVEHMIEKTEEQWKQELSTEAFRILREHGTERAFTNEFYHHKDEGSYTCAGCDLVLFDSDTKYDSGSGWPAFHTANEGSITEISDKSLGMVRNEVRCSRCDGHLGHVFNDGPKPTGMRYCVNSAALKFKKR